MQEFFTRALKDGARLIDSEPGVIVSPCDGTATSMSSAASTAGMIEQVKGISYPGMCMYSFPMRTGVGSCMLMYNVVCHGVPWSSAVSTAATVNART